MYFIHQGCVIPHKYVVRVPFDRDTTVRSRRVGQALLAGACIVIVVSWSALASASPEQKNTEAKPDIREFADPLLEEPYVDVDEWRGKPVRHRYVHGGFKGTDARFWIYFPPKHGTRDGSSNTSPRLRLNETEGTTGSGTGDQIGFSIASGAYFLVTNEGGFASLMKVPTLGAYRVNAAAAQYSRVLAAQIYGPHRTYGYAYGGSGGAFRTSGGFEKPDSHGELCWRSAAGATRSERMGREGRCAASEHELQSSRWLGTSIPKSRRKPAR